MVFPVVMYGYEKWIIKKAEHQRIYAFELCSWRRLFRSPLDCKEIKPVNHKGYEYSLEGLMLKLQYFGHLMQRVNSLEKSLMLGKTEGRRRGWQSMRWLNGTIDSMDMSLSKLLGDGEGQGGLVCCSSWACRKLDMTEQLNNSNSERPYWLVQI